MDLKEYIRSIQDYPKKGILFRDITTLIKNEKAFAYCIDQIVEKSKDFKFFRYFDYLIYCSGKRFFIFDQSCYVSKQYSLFRIIRN